MSDVPFWLEVLAIALAPALGFVGVALGAFWQTRTTKYLALRAHRERVYSNLIEATEDLKSHFSLVGPTVVRSRDSDDLYEHAGQFKAKTAAVVTLVRQIDVVGSPAAIDAAVNLIAFAADASMSTMHLMQDGFDRVEWLRVLRAGDKASSEFRDAAAKDLGVPHADRCRRSRRTPASDEGLASLMPTLNRLEGNAGPSDHVFPAESTTAVADDSSDDSRSP